MILKKLILLVSNLLEPTFTIGSIISDRYQVIKHLGTGGYGHSYLVLDQQLHHEIVLKALRFHKRIFRNGRQAFAHERELLKRIEHPGFPKYFQSGNHKNIPFYTMEYINGRNFEELIFNEGRQFNELETFKIANKLLQLIQYLHSNQIIHRDVRIPNVIYNGSHIWLIDLGLASKKQHKENRYRKGRDYLRKQKNDQADFYALGHFLLFLLYSNFSFIGTKKEKSWEEELEISSMAKDIIQKLLQIKPAYENCHEIQYDFQKLIMNREASNVIF